MSLEQDIRLAWTFFCLFCVCCREICPKSENRTSHKRKVVPNGSEWQSIVCRLSRANPNFTCDCRALVCCLAVGDARICTRSCFVLFLQAISSLLKEEMDKVTQAAETERRGALLKKFRQVERRSGGLCNPDLLEKVVRSSSSDPKNAPKKPPHGADFLPALGGAEATTATNASMGITGLSSPAAAGGAGFTSVAGVVGGELGTGEDVPWADDMLCSASRKRHAAVLRSRGRALAKSLAKMLRGVSSELQGVASRLPPWEDDEEDDADLPEEVGVVRS